ncbi:uncharacterized protein LOC143293407 [Babylonia areolata]|uniref:uncharacterized protein LOC143293407 n=1 Tax=Babylonia areolata TaxID=304850 RepID=UPI003FD1935A
MGETHDETETLPQEMSPEKTRKCRRNGMWNIFEGVDNTVLEKLGLSEEVVHQLVTEADDTVSHYLATHQADDDSLGDSTSSSGGCRCRKARILRSFSATVGEDMKAALQNRHRRNAVGNLFDVLTSSQKLLLVEHLQEQLERMSCLCGGEEEGVVNPATAARNEDNSSSSSSSNSNTIILSLTDFTASSEAGGSAPVSSSQPSSTEEVVCH